MPAWIPCHAGNISSQGCRIPRDRQTEDVFWPIRCLESALFPGGSPQTPVLASLDFQLHSVGPSSEARAGVWGLAPKRAPGRFPNFDRYIQDIATSRHRYSQVLLYHVETWWPAGRNGTSEARTGVFRGNPQGQPKWHTHKVNFDFCPRELAIYSEEKKYGASDQRDSVCHSCHLGRGRRRQRRGRAAGPCGACPCPCPCPCP